MTATTAEINYLDGVTSNIQTQIDAVTPLTTEGVQDIVGAMFTSNTETRIAVDYQDADGTIDLVVDDMTTHPSISAASSSDNSGRTYIQDITLDSNGHVTGIATATETVTDTNLTTEAVQDIVGAMFTSTNTETRITATYQDATGDIDLVVDDMTADTNTFRTVTAGGNTLGASETLAFTEGSNITISESGGAVTIASTDTNTQLSTEEVQDIAGPLVATGGTKTGITVTYDDTNNNMDFVVDHDAASNFVANEHIDHTSVSISTGTGLSGGGDISSTRTLSVDAAQTGITSVVNTGLEIGRDADNRIKFGTDNQIIFEVDGGDNVIFKTSGEIEATSLDISGNVDVDGTLETDALTINGTAMNNIVNVDVTTDSLTVAASGDKIILIDADDSDNLKIANIPTQLTTEQVQDIAGALVASGGTKTGITVTYDDTNNDMDFVVGTLNQDTTGTAANATLAATVTVSNSTANTDFPVVFHDESNALLDDTGALRYNPSTGTLLAPNLVVAGTTTTVDTVTMEASNAIIFEGATADANETTLSIVDPTGDRTINLPNVSGTIPVLAAASTTQISSTPEELNILDGATVTVAELNVLDGYTGSVTELNYLDALHGTGVTSTEFDYLDGVTSNIQTQLDTKFDTAGTGLTNSGTTVNVIGGTGITANANDIAVTAAQTGITSVVNASLEIGRDADNRIKFGTDNQIIFEVDGGDNVIFKTSGEIEATSLDISGNVDVDGTLEADAITVNGTSLPAVNQIIALDHTTDSLTAIESGDKLILIDANDSNNLKVANVPSSLTTEQVQDIAGGLITAAGGTKTGITITYDDTNNNMDFVVGTLNQDTTGNAATATALETARNIGGVSFDGTGNINLPGVNTSGNQDTSGTAANATHVTVADNESTNEDNLIPFIENTSATGNVGLESDGDLHYNPSTGTVTATIFKGNIDAVDGDFDGTLETDALTIGGVTSNAFTTTLKNKLDGIATSATANAGTVTSVATGTGVSGGTITGSGTISVDAAQTGITSILNTSLVVGRDGDNQIKFGTDNQIIFEVSGGDNVIFKASGEIEASSLDISGNVDVDGTLEADAITVNGTALPAVNQILATDVTTDSLTVPASGDKVILIDADDSDSLKVANFPSDTVRTVTAGGNTLADNETLAFTAGSNVTISESGGAVTIAADDAFLINSGNDTTSGTITAAGFTTSGTISVDDIHGNSQSNNRLVLDDDTRSGVANGVSLTAVNTIYLCCDETNNGTGEIKFLKATDQDLDGGTVVELGKFDNSGNFTATGSVTAASLDISGDVDVDGTLETDALTIGGTSVEAGADVTDATNVTAAGALMDSECTNLSAVKGINQALTTSSDVQFAAITQSSFVMDGNTISGIDDSGEFTNNDSHIMTSAAVEDKILGYGYTTNTGDITAVVAGTGLSGGNTSGSATLDIDVGTFGATGNQTIDSTTNTEAEYSNLPVGYAAMMHANLGTDEGMPEDSQYFYFNKIANRDTGGGWGGIALGYNNNEQFYVGNTTVNSAFATWSRVVVENSSGQATITGELEAASLDISGNADIDGTLETDALTINGTTSVAFTSSDHSKLDGIASGATANTGTVDTSGSPVDNDFAKFTDSNTIEGRSASETRSDLGLVIGTNVLAQQTIGIANDNLVEIDSSSVADNDIARFTANGLEGRSYAELISDLGLGELALLDDVPASRIPNTFTDITSIKNSSLVVGRDDDNGIHFSTDNAIKVEVNGVQDEFRFVAGGEFHADADIVAFSSTTASDKNLKENVEALPYGLDDVMKMRAVEFDWKKDKANGKERGHDIGVIAQEMEEVIPEVVKEYEGLQGKDNFKAVDYSKLVPVLIKSIQQLKAEIEELKK